MRTCILFLLHLAILGRPATGDGHEWVVNPANGHSYAKTSPGLTWPQAEVEAVMNGGHLATVRSTEEDAWIHAAFGAENYWIGFTDQDSEGAWVWISGEPVTYTNWHPGEPNDQLGEDYCIVDPTTADWADGGSGPPWGSHYGVIEVEFGPIPTGRRSWGHVKSIFK